jgi:hypothetical protein
MACFPKKNLGLNTLSRPPKLSGRGAPSIAIQPSTSTLRRVETQTKGYQKGQHLDYNSEERAQSTH